MAPRPPSPPAPQPTPPRAPPGALTQAIRNFAKSLEGWLTAAMVHVPEEMVRVKLAAAGALAQTLRRYTSLNHLAQAARAVLQNSAQISQMLSDLNRVDFANVQVGPPPHLLPHPPPWVFGCCGAGALWVWGSIGVAMGCYGADAAPLVPHSSRVLAVQLQGWL